MKQRIYYLLPVFLVLILGCQSQEVPKEEIDKTLLVGNWELTKAYRNRKITETLKDAFFFFRNDSTLNTNILGETEDQYFYWQDSMLVTDKAISYKIQLLRQDSLQLSFKIQSFEFDLLLNRIGLND